MGAIGGVEGKAIPHMLPVVLSSFVILTQLSAGSVISAEGKKKITDGDEPIPWLPFPRWKTPIREEEGGIDLSSQATALLYASIASLFAFNPISRACNTFTLPLVTPPAVKRDKQFPDQV